MPWDDFWSCGPPERPQESHIWCTRGAYLFMVSPNPHYSMRLARGLSYRLKDTLEELVANSGPALLHFKFIALGSHSASLSLSFLVCHMELKSSISQNCCGDLMNQFESLVQFLMCSGCLETNVSFSLSNKSQQQCSEGLTRLGKQIFCL